MWIHCLFLAGFWWCIHGYSRPLFSLRNFSINEYEEVCILNTDDNKLSLKSHKTRKKIQPLSGKWARIIGQIKLRDPYEAYMSEAHQNLYGKRVDDADYVQPEQPETTVVTGRSKVTIKDIESDQYAHFPCGQIRRAEVFNNKSAVHFPPKEFMFRGHACLRVTKDNMQTAINAFAILLDGTTTDVTALPPDYVLRSARTIAMMKITREKLAALWDVVKNKRQPVEVQHYELEMFRPLFKYVNAREMGKLNLSDDRVLTYLGTHPELDRHQVGVIASRYLQVNRNWTQVQYLNKMNNLLCGVPMIYMRSVLAEIYLQLTSQVFYHIRACDSLQRRFYLSMMTRTEVLGKSFSWSAQDVSRLGLLLAEVSGPNLAIINPEALSAITAQVMMEMKPENLVYLTEPQLKYLGLKPLNIMSRKLKAFNEKNRYRGSGVDSTMFLHNIKLLTIAILLNIVKIKRYDTE